MLTYHFPSYSFHLCLSVFNMQDFMEIVFLMCFQNSLIEMQFICHAIHPFKAYNSIVVFSQLCNHISFRSFSSPEKEKGSVVQKMHFLQTLKPLSVQPSAFILWLAESRLPFPFYSHSSLSGMVGKVAFTVSFLFHCLYSEMCLYVFIC